MKNQKDPWFAPNLGKLKKDCFFIKALEAGLLNKRLMLTSSFRCDQNYKYEIYDFCHTLLCYLSWT
jgi:hypothetical protein